MTTFIDKIVLSGLEPDQRIIAALKHVPYTVSLRDETFFGTLYRLNFIGARNTKIDSVIAKAAEKHPELIGEKDWDINKIVPEKFLGMVLDRAISFATNKKTLGVGHLLKSWASFGIEYADQPGFLHTRSLESGFQYLDLGMPFLLLLG